MNIPLYCGRRRRHRRRATSFRWFYPLLICMCKKEEKNVVFSKFFSLQPQVVIFFRFGVCCLKENARFFFFFQESMMIPARAVPFLPRHTVITPCTTLPYNKYTTIHSMSWNTPWCTTPRRTTQCHAMRSFYTMPYNYFPSYPIPTPPVPCHTKLIIPYHTSYTQHHAMPCHA